MRCPAWLRLQIQKNLEKVRPKPAPPAKRRRSRAAENHGTGFLASAPPEIRDEIARKLGRKPPSRPEASGSAGPLWEESSEGEIVDPGASPAVEHDPNALYKEALAENPFDDIPF